MGEGSDIYAMIWDSVSRIPRGKVATYGDIAQLCGLPAGARRIGYALHRTPPGMRIPWQRVVNARGMISLPKEGGHYRRQMSLLRREGIVFVNDRIDLRKYRWLKHLGR